MVTPQCDFAFRLIDQGACLGTDNFGTFLMTSGNQLWFENIDGTPKRGFEACHDMVKAEVLRRNGTCRMTPPTPPVPPPDNGVVLPPVIDGEEVGDNGEIPPPVTPPVIPPIFPGEFIPGVPNETLAAGVLALGAIGIGVAFAVGSFIQQGRGL